MTKRIICESCKKEIKDKEDLVTVNHYLQVIPLHNDCFDKDKRGVMALLFSNHRLNGWTGILSYILVVIIGIWLTIMIDSVVRYIPLIFIIIETYYRLLSYFQYERHYSNHITNDHNV